MKLIIAGSRSITEMRHLEAAWAASPWWGTPDLEVVHGDARGVDQLAEEWAASWGIPQTKFLADWNSFGPAAGPIRNQLMAAYGEKLLAIWDGRSRGTASMIREAERAGKEVFVWHVKDVTP